MSARKVKRGAGAKGGDGPAAAPHAAPSSAPPSTPPAAPHVAPAAAQGRGGLRRVAITGMGTVNALGRNVPDTLTAMREARCGIGELEFQDVDRLSVRIGAQVRDWDPEAYFNRQQISLYDKFTQFTMIAAKEAVAQSGLSFHGELGLCSGVILGTAGGGLNTWDENYRIVYEEGKNRVHPFVVPKLMNNAAASHVSMEFGLRGPAFTVATACASSNHAMGLAFQMVRSGAARVMLAGGSEAMLCFGGVKAWEGLRVMSRDACRPFSANRNGMVQGEGAGVFVFEDWDHATARGAEIFAEVVGFAMSADAQDIVMPSAIGAERAIAGAMVDAGLNPSDIGYINAHGTGTAANDKTECAAVAHAFGHHADRLMLSSTKSMHGHLIGGTGAVELLACVMALRDGIIAPTIGYEEPDPECALDVVPNVAREARVEAVLSNAFAFGGLNAVIALRRV
ncbi:beta-ketoacyl-[acyl-carrier-protein] synthase family protein [Paracoccus panacisoli]